MSNLTYLFVAFAFIWSGVLAYMIRLSGLRKQLEERIESLQDRLEKKELRND
jgi:CcmD family protein